VAQLPDAVHVDTWMRRALAEARRALDHDDVPVGAIVVRLDDEADAEPLAVAQNARERDRDPTAHAEILALRAAAMALGQWRLDDCALVVTLEPCTMCAGAALHARVGAVVFGAYDLRFGALGSRYNLLADPRLNHQAPVIGGVRADDASGLLQSFFTERR
jgi:tRNA(adenine34) deaminase